MFLLFFQWPMITKDNNGHNELQPWWHCPKLMTPHAEPRSPPSSWLWALLPPSRGKRRTDLLNFLSTEWVQRPTSPVSPTDMSRGSACQWTLMTVTWWMESEYCVVLLGGGWKTSCPFSAPIPSGRGVGAWPPISAKQEWGNSSHCAQLTSAGGELVHNICFHRAEARR